MRFPMEKRHRLNAVTVLTLAGGCGPLVIASLVLGSGILPVPFTGLLLTGLLVGVMSSIPLFTSGRNPRRFKVLGAGYFVTYEMEQRSPI